MSNINPIETVQALQPCPFCGGPASEMMGLVGCEPCAIARRDADSWNRRALLAQMQSQPSDDLHAAIMNLPCRVPFPLKEEPEEARAYRRGHLDARHAAAELVASRATVQPSDEREAFDMWWESSGQGAEPLHTLITENCARAAFQAGRALGPVKAQQEPVAWMHRNGMKVMPADEKAAYAQAPDDFSREIAAEYSIPLYPAAHQGAQPAVPDGFNGDTPHLIRSIESLLALDANGALSHRIGGHARTLLSAAASRLAAAPSASAQPQGDRHE